MRKFLKFLPLFGIVGIVTPLALTSCSNKSAASFREFDLTQNKLTNMREIHEANGDIYSTLLHGGKKVHNGNYFLIIGSNTSSSFNKFMTGQSSKSINYFYDDLTFASEISSSFEHAHNLEQTYDFGMYMYVDFENPVNRTPGMELFGALDYDYKWKEDDIEKIKQNHPDKKDVYKANKYARNDDSAVAMRQLVDWLKLVYTSDKIKISGVDSFPYVMVWKNGKPQTDKFKTISTEKDLKDIIDLYDTSKKS
ncbi:MAG: putative lipoprotein [Candidatus Malacoplasma girerdii]|nr:MAG: putative lipoprotein [Candidatus Malacoplasma girerdii]